MNLYTRISDLHRFSRTFFEETHDQASTTMFVAEGFALSKSSDFERDR